MSITTLTDKCAKVEFTRFLQLEQSGIGGQITGHNLEQGRGFHERVLEYAAEVRLTVGRRVFLRVEKAKGKFGANKKLDMRGKCYIHTGASNLDISRRESPGT